MDAEQFRNGMGVLCAVFDRGQLTERQVEIRYLTYQRLFAGDDGETFEQACLEGASGVWRFFPTPVEIREQMAAIEQRRGRLLLAVETRRRIERSERADPRELYRRLFAEMHGEVKEAAHLQRGGAPEAIGGVVLRLMDRVTKAPPDGQEPA